MEEFLAIFILCLMVLFIIIPALGLGIVQGRWPYYSPDYFECLFAGIKAIIYTFMVIGLFCLFFWSLSVFMK